ncbi:MAG: arginine repressor [Clostridia bacterium]|nr:arginine repressor [Clostridia bacterium]
MKLPRHTKIIELIRKHEVTTQEKLLELLQQEGFSVTQATVSRDIRELRLVKQPTSHGVSKYTIPETEEAKNKNAKYGFILSETMISAEAAGNLVVIKTYAGMANAAASSIDAFQQGSVVGTLAGDDTIFAVLRTEAEAESFLEELKKWIKRK